jgi:peptidoglycan hydrolase-like protein with peptidoglycan-binding domain
LFLEQYKVELPHISSLPKTFKTIQNPTQTMQGTASGVCDPNSPILRIGSSGPKVQELQRYLTQLGYGYGYLLEKEEDGKFRPATQNAVKTFQLENRLDLVDGIAGPTTVMALAELNAFMKKLQNRRVRNETLYSHVIVFPMEVVVC